MTCTKSTCFDAALATMDSPPGTLSISLLMTPSALIVAKKLSLSTSVLTVPSWKMKSIEEQMVVGNENVTQIKALRGISEVTNGATKAL